MHCLQISATIQAIYIEYQDLLSLESGTTVAVELSLGSHFLLPHSVSHFCAAIIAPKALNHLEHVRSHFHP